MPLYEYQCQKCGERFEIIQKFSDPLVTAHETCGGVVKKLLSAPAIQFKGSGWYITDYARAGKNGSTKDGKDGDSSKSESKATEGKSSESKASEGKSESKSESKSSEGKSSSSGDSSTATTTAKSGDSPKK